MNDEWKTPIDLFNKLDDEFDFQFDLCTNGEANSLCTAYSTDIVDHVSNGAHYDSYWMNPPYSRGNIGLCMEQAYKLYKEGRVVVCLVRFDPSAKWFQNWVDGKAAEVRMLDRRVKFQGADSAYNFPCCVVVYDPGINNGNLITEYNIWGWQ